MMYTGRGAHLLVGASTCKDIGCAFGQFYASKGMVSFSFFLFFVPVSVRVSRCHPSSKDDVPVKGSSAPLLCDQYAFEISTQAKTQVTMHDNAKTYEKIGGKVPQNSDFAHKPFGL